MFQFVLGVICLSIGLSREKREMEYHAKHAETSEERYERLKKKYNCEF